MKFYLAGPYSQAPYLRTCADTLARLGHTVTSRWLFREEKNAGNGSTGLAIAAQEDLEDIAEAEAIVLFTGLPALTNRGGRHVEFGVAMASDKFGVVVGPRENIFHYLPEVLVADSWEDFLEAIAQAGA